ATMFFADAHAEYWKWKDTRTVETCKMTWDDFVTNWQFKDCPDNVDLKNMRIAGWGKIPGKQ
ncbi:MAG: hypothetical protein KAS23_11385, partial [Anaerohalosphaera sp.]|nr:hypothetical protein [Anaerohalosphaera sp.]